MADSTLSGLVGMSKYRPAFHKITRYDPRHPSVIAIVKSDRFLSQVRSAYKERLQLIGEGECPHWSVSFSLQAMAIRSPLGDHATS